MKVSSVYFHDYSARKAGIPEVFSVPIPEVHVPTQINKDKSKLKVRLDAIIIV